MSVMFQSIIPFLGTHSDGIEGSSVPIICVKNEDGQLCDDILCEYDKQEYYTYPFKIHSEVDNGSEVTHGDSNSNPLFSDSGYERNKDFNGDLHKEDNFIRSFTPDYPFIHESWDATNQVCLKEDGADGDRQESSSNKSFCNPQFEAQTDPHNHIRTETLACTETLISDTEIDPLGDYNASDDFEGAIPSSHTSEFQELHVLPTRRECLSRTSLSPSCSSTSRDFFLHEFSKSFEEPAPLRDENELTISSYLVGDNLYPVHRYQEGLATFMPSTSEEKESLCEVMNNGLAETDDDLCRDMSQENMHSIGTSEDDPLQINSILAGNVSPKLLENGDGTTGEPVQMKKKMGGNHRKALKTPRPGRNPPRLNSISCTTIKGCSQHAVTFAQRQMHDIELLANKLTKELKHMKAVLKDRVQTDEPKTASPSYDTLARTAIRNATRAGETTQKWLSIMSRNCDRFCKIMRMSEMGASALPSGAKKMRRITFADEVGGVLCHVRFFEDDTAAEPDPDAHS